MKNLLFLFLSFLCIPPLLHAQQNKILQDSLQINPYIEGNLVRPAGTENPPLVIFIQGSGQTDRNGNQGPLKSDYAKKIAYQLADNKIASFRFDKRSLKARELKLDTILFDDFVTDVTHILSYFKKEGSFSKLIVAGHSQGSLIGMLAAKANADAFISLAGPGNSIDHILVEQLTAQFPQFEKDLQDSFRELKQAGTTENYPKLFQSIFHPQNQAFLANWMQYDPAQEISKLEIPVLIVQGTRDLQLKEEQAKMLHQAAAGSKMVLLKDMNHVFREIKEEEKNLNLASYSNPDKPLHPEIIPLLSDFIENLENK